MNIVLNEIMSLKYFFHGMFHRVFEKTWKKTTIIYIRLLRKLIPDKTLESYNEKQK